MRKKYGEVQVASDEAQDTPSFKERHQGELGTDDDAEIGKDSDHKL